MDEGIFIPINIFFIAEKWKLFSSEKWTFTLHIRYFVKNKKNSKPFDHAVAYVFTNETRGNFLLPMIQSWTTVGTAQRIFLALEKIAYNSDIN